MQKPNEDPEKKKEEDDFLKDKNKGNDKFEDLYNYAKHNTKDTIAFILMLAGLLLMFYEPWYGGILIGLIFGLYFSKELLDWITHIEKCVQDLGMVKSIILLGLLIAFLIAAPYIFVGVVFILVLRYLLISNT